METVIKLNGINKIYRTDEVETQALENVNLEVRKGEFLSIMGPSGCGKSTLLNIMGLLDEPTSGEIELCGTRIDPKLSDNRLAELRNKTLGFVFQSFHLIPTLNVLDNVQLPLIYRGVRSGERQRLAKEVIERVGLSHRMKHRPTQLSGGQCQRVAIARAIIGNPEILLADEPTGNLDSKMGAEIMELLHRLNREDGRTIVMVTHNEQQAAQTDRIIKFLDYIAGTAVAIASAMVIAIVFNMLLADIPPEVNRSRTLYVSNRFIPGEKSDDVPYHQGLSSMALDSCYRRMKCVEAATGIIPAYQNNYTIESEAQLGQGQYEAPRVSAIATDHDFFRFYDLDFIDGRPFSKKESDEGERVCVVTDKVAERTGTSTGATVRVNGKPFRVVGVVKAVSAFLEDATADIYLPIPCAMVTTTWT